MTDAAADDFKLWAETRRDRLRKAAFLMGGDWHQADDLVQEALIRAFVVWPRIVSKGDPDAYVRKILVNRFLDHQRRSSRRESPVERVLEPRTREPDPLLAIEERDRIVDALALVPPGQRAVLVLRYYEDLSVAQVARALGRSEGHVKSQAARGLKSVRRAMNTVTPAHD